MATSTVLLKSLNAVRHSQHAAGDASAPLESSLGSLSCSITDTLSCWLQVNGHYMAKLDPLGLDKRPMPVELDPALYGFSDRDMDKE